MSLLYKLDGHNPVPCYDTLDWARWNETANRIVAVSSFEDTYVSTIFLGLDHGFVPGVPVLFETMVFVRGNIQDCQRYATWEQAEVGHAAMCARAFATTPLSNAL